MNSPSAKNRTTNQPIVFRWIVAASVCVLVPFLAAVRVPDGFPLWWVSALLGLPAGWWAGRTSQWDRDPEFDPWERGCPAYLRWLPAGTAVALAALLGVGMWQADLQGAKSDVVEVAVPPASAPVATVAPGVAETTPEGAEVVVSAPPGSAPAASAPSTTIDAIGGPDGLVEFGHTVIREWMAGGTIPGVREGAVVDPAPAFPLVGVRNVGVVEEGAGWVVTFELIDDASGCTFDHCPQPRVLLTEGGDDGWTVEYLLLNFAG